MDRPIILRGRKVSLAMLHKEDVKKLWLWYNDRDIRKYLSNPEEIFFFEDELEWYERIRKEKERHKVFAIVENGSSNLVGLIGIHNIDHKNGKAEIGYFLWRDYWGRGYATEAVGLTLRYCFEWLNLRKVYAHVFEPNVASSKVLEKNGFVLVGRWRRHMHVVGEGFVDVLCYELMREEWKG